MKQAITRGAVLVLTLSSVAAAQDRVATYREGQHQAIAQWVDAHLPDLLMTCKHLHAHPELSQHEVETAALVAEELQKAGYEVTTGVGGNGVVGLLKNGEGPTVMVRGDMDALPIAEETGLDYASKVTATTSDGQAVGVMHACGHDIHSTVLIGTAEALATIRDQWRGSLLMVAQPAEEVGVGAKAMIADGLFERFARPDYCISLHVSHRWPAGHIAYTPGWAAANVDSVDITIHGRGGHGAKPNTTVDPIVAAAYVVTQLQTLVSRRIDPIEPAVVTVGSIHGGSKHNIIPDEVHMQLTVRSYTDEVRNQLLDGIERITRDVCRSFQCPKPPDIVVEDNFTPACYNDPALTRQAAEVFRHVLGDDNVTEQPSGMGGEDFGQYARYLKVPALQFSLGTVKRDVYEASLKPGAAPLPSLHSSKYRADMEPSLQTGIEAMATLAVSLLDSPE